MSFIHYDVTMVRQQSSPVCWLACAAMIIQFRRHYTPSSSQLRIEGDEDFRGSLTLPVIERCFARLKHLGFEVRRFSQLRTQNAPRPPSMTTGRSRSAPAATATTDQEVIFELLQNYGPLILSHFLGSFWYGPNRQLEQDGERSGHAVTIVGMDTGRNIVYFNNPWGERNVMTSTQSIVNAIRRYESAHRAHYAIAYLNEPMQ